jgi:hypothetical protein
MAKMVQVGKFGERTVREAINPLRLLLELAFIVLVVVMLKDLFLKLIYIMSFYNVI